MGRDQVIEWGPIPHCDCDAVTFHQLTCLYILALKIQYTPATPKRLNCPVASCRRRVDGICGSGQSGTVKNGGVENAGVDISARYGKGRHCGNGQCGTIVARVDNAGGKNVSKLA